MTDDDTKVTSTPTREEIAQLVEFVRNHQLIPINGPRICEIAERLPALLDAAGLSSDLADNLQSCREELSAARACRDGAECRADRLERERAAYRKEAIDYRDALEKSVRGQAEAHRFLSEANWARGFAEGRLSASEIVGVVEGWRERALKAESECDVARQEATDAQGAVQVYCDDFNKMKDERDGACRNAKDSLAASTAMAEEVMKCRAVTVDLTNAVGAISDACRASADRVRVLEEALRPFAAFPSLATNDRPDGAPVFIPVIVGDVRRAIAALGESSPNIPIVRINVAGLPSALAMGDGAIANVLDAHEPINGLPVHGEGKIRARVFADKGIWKVLSHE